MKGVWFMVVVWRVLVGVVLVGVFAGRVFGQTAPAREELSGVVAPFVDSGTLVVGHVDVSGVDVGAVEKYLGGVVEGMKGGEEMRKSFGEMRVVAEGMMGRLQALGGRHVFFVVEHGDLWPGMDPFAVLVKVEGGKEVKGMVDFLRASVGAEYTVAPIGEGMVFVGAERAYVRMKGMKAEARGEFRFAGGEGMPLEVIGALTPDVKRALVELMPVLPKEVGGESMEVLTKELESFRLTMTLPPTPEVAFQIKTLPRVAGGVTGAAWERMIPVVRELILKSETFQGPAAGELRGVAERVLTPSMGGTIASLPLTMDFTFQAKAPEIRVLARALLPGFRYERRVAGRVESGAAMHRVLRGVFEYAGEHQGVAPESLEVLVKSGKLGEGGEKLLVSPLDGKGYVYRPGGLEVGKWKSDVGVMWEAVGDEEGGNVGFGDGHVEYLRGEGFLKVRGR